MYRSRPLPTNLVWLLMLVQLGFLAGCNSSPETADVSGTVKLNGKAPNLEGLQISFMGKDGRPVTTEVDKEGKFRATRVPVGEAHLGLTYTPPDAIAAQEKLAKARPENPDEPAKKLDPRLKLENKQLHTSAYKNPIPDHLRDPRTSKKTITIEAGKDNILNWDVRR